MEGSLDNRERRKYPRIVIDLPLEYQEKKEDPGLRGAMVVNASKGGFLIESTRDMPVGAELSITLLFSREFELTNFKAEVKVVHREPHSKKNSNGNQVWEGYLYGLEFIQISDEDHRKLNWLLGDQFEFDETFLSLFCQP